jgi:hypothetical protein
MINEQLSISQNRPFVGGVEGVGSGNRLGPTSER